MKNLADQLHHAVAALIDYRLRTALSILGITIGIAAVMAVSTISKGGNHLVFSELETFGLNSVWVYRNRNNSPFKQARSGSGINTADFHAAVLRSNTLGIGELTPTVRAHNQDLKVRRGSRYANTDLVGVGDKHRLIVNDAITRGRSFNQDDMDAKKPVALIAPEVSSKLFDVGEDPIGKTIRVGDRRFYVVGVLASKSREFLASIGSAGGQNANDRMLIPYSVMQQMNGNDSIDYLHIAANRYEEAEQVAEKMTAFLSRRHRNLFSYRTETMASYIQTTDRILGGVAIVGVIAASISLLVGGMGIMNMMGTSVLERTREIGIRKVGGVLGLLIGGIASVTLAYISGFPLVPSFISIIAALLVSVLVGILSGYLPARRAAKMQPVEALRAN